MLVYQRVPRLYLGCLGLLNGCHGRPPSSGDFPIAMPPLFRPPAGCASVRHRLWKRITRCGMIIRILYTHIYLHIYNLILIWFTVICNYIIHFIASYYILHRTYILHMYVCNDLCIYIYICTYYAHITKQMISDQIRPRFCNSSAAAAEEWFQGHFATNLSRPTTNTRSRGRKVTWGFSNFNKSLDLGYPISGP